MHVKVVKQFNSVPWKASRNAAGIWLGLFVCLGVLALTLGIRPNRLYAADSSITIVKLTDPAGAPDVFTFSSNFDPATFNLADGQSETAVFTLPPDPGLLTVTEDSLPPNWTLTDIDCLAGTSSITFQPSGGPLYTEGDNSIEIELGFSDSVECTFTNTKKRGAITINKITEPDGSAETFTFNSATTTLAGTIGDDGSLTALELDDGRYTFSEADKTGWDLTDITCTGATNSTVTIGATGDFDAGDTSVQVDLVDGEEIDCTFTNTERSSLAIVKQGFPETGEQFTFTGDLSGELMIGESLTTGSIPPTELTVAETNLPEGWVLEGIFCEGATDSDWMIAASGDAVTVDLAPGEDVVCTFSNRQLDSLTIVKQTVPAGATDEFTFMTNVGDPITLTDGQSFTLYSLNPTEIIVSESALPAGWAVTDIDCPVAGEGIVTFGDGTTHPNFDFQPGDTSLSAFLFFDQRVCTFTNTKLGTITVEKITDPSDSAETFDFTGELEGTIGNMGTLSKQVLPGTYDVTETIVAPWAIESITCTDDDSSGDIVTGVTTFNVAAGEEITCTYTNRKPQPDIAIEKSTSTAAVNQNTNTVVWTIVATNSGDAAGDATIFDDFAAINMNLVNCVYAGTPGVTGFGDSAISPLNVSGTIPAGGGVTYTCTGNYSPNGPIFGEDTARTGCYEFTSADPMPLITKITNNVVLSGSSSGSANAEHDVECGVVTAVTVREISTQGMQSSVVLLGVALVLLTGWVAIFGRISLPRQRP